MHLLRWVLARKSTVDALVMRLLSMLSVADHSAVLNSQVSQRDSRNLLAVSSARSARSVPAVKAKVKAKVKDHRAVGTTWARHAEAPSGSSLAALSITDLEDVIWKIKWNFHNPTVKWLK